MTIRSFRHSRTFSAIALALALPACLADDGEELAPVDDEGDLSALADDVKVAPSDPVAKLWDQPQAIDNVVVRPYYRKTLTLSGSPAIHTITTLDLQQGGSWEPDPVIIAQSGTEQWTNDNCVGKAACVLLPGTLTSVTLTIFGRQPQAYGTTDVLVDGVKVENDVPFGGTLIPISWNPAGTDFAIETVGKPDGTVDETLFHLGSDFRYKTSNTSGGILAHARLVATPVQGDFILVASPSTASNPGTGLTRVLFNSCLTETDSCQGGSAAFSGDTDGDGLANYLESQIGTDPAHRDSDRDGIFDYQEVIGLRLGGAEEDLPRYGADPRHGDLFVEMDTSFTGTSNSNRPADDDIVVRMADMFASLSGWGNPDGVTGIRLHVDGGAVCADPTMCNDWGGSNHYQHACEVPSKATARANMAPLRQGIFHYTLRTCSGASSAPGLTVLTRIGPDNDADEGEVWAHELGHHFDLRHGGDPLYPLEGQLNRSPAYPSTMNYAYQNDLGPEPDAQFSRGLMQRIRPENQSETGYTPGRSKAYLHAAPFRYGVSGDNVDFNGDGRLGPTPVFYDPGPLGERSGNWGDVRDLRDIDVRTPTGGVGMAVLPTVSGGGTSRVYIAAPYQHSNGVYPDIQWTTEVPSGVAQSFSAPKPSSPLPGGADPHGEVAAALVTFESAPAVFVTMPNAAGKLHYAHFRTTNHTWTSWTPMPNWFSTHRARQATVVNTLDRMYLLYRDLNAAEDVPNVWMNTFEEGQWRGWRQLTVPSYLTPGLAVGPDDKLYLLHVTHAAGPSTVTLRLKLSTAAWAGTQPLVFTPIDNLDWAFANADGSGLGNLPIADDDRTRLTLLSVPYREGGGAPFADGSHYLLAYWVTGTLGSAESLQANWTLRRAQVPGYIRPTTRCFGQTIQGDPCSATATVRARYHKQTDRPWPGFSPAAAERWNMVSAAFVASLWDDDGDGANESFPDALDYQPWATGVYPGHWEIRDTNDAAIMRRNACKSLRSLTDQQCTCDDSCSSLASRGFLAASAPEEPVAQDCTPDDHDDIDLGTEPQPSE